MSGALFGLADSVNNDTHADHGACLRDLERALDFKVTGGGDAFLYRWGEELRALLIEVDKTSESVRYD